MKKINIEIKAKSADQNMVLQILKQLRADFKGIDIQKDTYFKVRQGRLKIREGNIEQGLIYYHRPDSPTPKKSEVIIHRSGSYKELKEILIKLLGVRVIVEKKREIYYIDNVKIHLDEVKQLGAFVEIEAQGNPDKVCEEDLLKQCFLYMDLFKIKQADLIAGSYSDLILDQENNNNEI